MAITEYSRPAQYQFTPIPFEELRMAGASKQMQFNKSAENLSAVDEALGDVKALSEVFVRGKGGLATQSVDDAARVEQYRKDYHQREQELIEGVGGNLTDPRVQRFINSEQRKLKELLAPTGEFGRYQQSWEVAQKRREAIAEARDTKNAYWLLGQLGEFGEKYASGESKTLIQGQIGNAVDLIEQQNELSKNIEPDVDAYAYRTTEGDIDWGTIKEVTKEKIYDKLGVEYVKDNGEIKMTGIGQGSLVLSDAYKTMQDRYQYDLATEGEEAARMKFNESVKSFVDGIANGKVLRQEKAYKKETAEKKARGRSKAKEKTLESQKVKRDVWHNGVNLGKSNVEYIDELEGTVLSSQSIPGREYTQYQIIGLAKKTKEKDNKKYTRYWADVKRPLIEDGEYVLDDTGKNFVLVRDRIPLDEGVANSIEEKANVKLPDDWVLPNEMVEVPDEEAWIDDPLRMGRIETEPVKKGSSLWKKWFGGDETETKEEESSIPETGGLL